MKLKLTLIFLLFGYYLIYGQSLKTPTLSPFSEISQEVGLTKISLSYSRPSAKGRAVFGALVPYEQIWRTGANASTKITFTEEAKIGGKQIKAGTYALYTIPGKKSWTIIIHSNTKLRSLAGKAYDPSKDVFRFEVKPEKLNNFTETFTIHFSDIRTNAVNLQLAWEKTSIKIPIEVEVEQKIEKQMTELLKRPEKVPHRTYFKAAQYYFTNNKDLNKALSWINDALKKSQKNFRYGLLKAKIENKSGDREQALKTIDLALNWAKEANNANYIGQTSLFKASLEKKK